MRTAIQNNNLVGMDSLELERIAQSFGKAPYHGRQLYAGLYRQRKRSFADFTDLDRGFRETLSAQCQIAYPEIHKEFVSKDGSVRYLMRLHDGSFIETVYMPEEGRSTLCLSSQVGCAVGCRFCFTALLGLKRNLSAGEILGQVMLVAETKAIPLRSHVNLVFMGMGEPLLNVAQLMKAVKILQDPKGLAIPLRRIAVSTSGIIPSMHDLAREPIRPKLAISLNASNDKERSELMPINRKYPLSELIRACRTYPLRPREFLTFEYILLDGFNDADDDALRVANLLRGLRAKVNLIPFNSGAKLPFRPSPRDRILAFQRILIERNIPAYVRVSRGQDIHAACGQLSLEGIQPISPSN